MEAFVGTILIWPIGFAPQGWLYCDGRILPVSQYQALFSLIGATYGGNGQTTFALPDLRGMVVVGAGNSQQGTYQLGQTGGSSQVTLNQANMPIHTHSATVSTAQDPIQVTISASSNAATSDAPAEGLQLADVTPNLTKIYTPTGGTQVPLGGVTTTATPGLGLNVNIGAAGGSQPFSNLQPFISLNFIICTVGLYPPRP